MINKKSRNHQDQKGFTIVELMIASAVFSAVLILISMALLSIGRSFQRGVIASRTQDAARSVANEISESVKLDGKGVIVIQENNGGTTKGYCVGKKRYSYVLTNHLTGEWNPAAGTTGHALVVDEVVGCTTSLMAQDFSGAATVSGRELLSQNMRLIDFTIQNIGGVYDISVTVAHTGGEDEIESIPDSDGYYFCDADSATSQFCAVSNLRTSVVPRLKP
jgi:prepilin-type N-terminal cleavage/methylation domain-containing protein